MSVKGNHIMSVRGGKRKGAGRKKGSGAFREVTVVKRIPRSLVPAVQNFLEEVKIKRARNAYGDIGEIATPKRIPMATSPVRAGFLTATAASDPPQWMDFNHLFSGNSKGVIAVRAYGDSMIDIGIEEGDLLILDTERIADQSDIVVARIDGDFTVKRLRYDHEGVGLFPENSSGKYPIQRPKPGEELNLIGVVTYVIKKL